MSVTENALIKKAVITKADHGLLSAWLTLDYGGTGQAFGGYSLYLPDSFSHHDMNINYAGHFIFRCLEIADVDDWERMNGKTIRVKKDKPFGSIEAIGHIIKDDWFNPSKDFKETELLSEDHE